MAIQAQLYPSNAGFSFCGSQDFMTDIQSCFNSQQNHQQHVSCLKHQQPAVEQRLQQLYNEKQRNQNMSAVSNLVDPNLLLSNSNAYNATNKYNNNHPSTPNSQSLVVEFDNQRDEVDHYIRLQNEKLRIMLQEQRKQQVAALLKKVEADALYVLSQKDEQIAQAAKKRAELEEFLRRLEAENQSWRRVAQENEAMVLSLHNTLEQMKERASYCFTNGVAAEDAESCCDQSRRNMAMEEGTGENRVCRGGLGDAEQITRKMMLCKCCNSRSSCFMLLPCRHLCSCKACEPFLEACPVCRMPKKSSIETLIF